MITIEFHCLFTASEVLNGVAWSAALNKEFRNNYNADPTLTWQYFGSASGFFRTYPGKFHFTVLPSFHLLARLWQTQI